MKESTALLVLLHVYNVAKPIHWITPYDSYASENKPLRKARTVLVVFTTGILGKLVCRF